MNWRVDESEWAETTYKNVEVDKGEIDDMVSHIW
jgi:hypothetical protein